MLKHMFDIVDNALDVKENQSSAYFCRTSQKKTGGSLQLICNAPTAFLHCGGRVKGVIP